MACCFFQCVVFLNVKSNYTSVPKGKTLNCMNAFSFERCNTVHIVRNKYNWNPLISNGNDAIATFWHWLRFQFCTRKMPSYDWNSTASIYRKCEPEKRSRQDKKCLEHAFSAFPSKFIHKVERFSLYNVHNMNASRKFHINSFGTIKIATNALWFEWKWTDCQCFSGRPISFCRCAL